MREFQFKKTYEEFKIAGKVYKVDFSDPAVKRYQIELYEYMKRSKELQKVDTDKLDKKGQEKAFNDALDAMRTFVDAIMGGGSFDELYKASGEYSENMVEFVEFLAEIVGERAQRLKQKAKKHKYKKKKAN
ncbi:hypothetical protein [Salipaludibacillus aurantiacus]|uniref:Phage tail assembly chaperone protein, TAC n=1 Tax=Salipaludibacillus aurantiacus TaxID=1601833 RepID=A0A1H9U065_9BACI|nr:hypothetical protein [Salipaludibacillus aurantiacus]SES02628.1 hypothetical protein SAMN05518684_106197 [Salipaludibacillus aurantiacus]